MKTTDSLRTAALGALFAGVAGSTVGAYLRPQSDGEAGAQSLVVGQHIDPATAYFDGPVWPGDGADFD